MDISFKPLPHHNAMLYSKYRYNTCEKSIQYFEPHFLFLKCTKMCLNDAKSFYAKCQPAGYYHHVICLRLTVFVSSLCDLHFIRAHVSLLFFFSSLLSSISFLQPVSDGPVVVTPASFPTRLFKAYAVSCLRMRSSVCVCVCMCLYPLFISTRYTVDLLLFLWCR